MQSKLSTRQDIKLRKHRDILASDVCTDDLPQNWEIEEWFGIGGRTLVGYTARHNHGAHCYVATSLALPRYGCHICASAAASIE